MALWLTLVPGPSNSTPKLAQGMVIMPSGWKAWMLRPSCSSVLCSRYR